MLKKHSKMFFSDPKTISTISPTNIPTANKENIPKQAFKENIIRDLKPILQVARIFGVAPYSINKINFTWSKSGLIYSTICFTFYCYIYINRVLLFMNHEFPMKLIILYLLIMVSSAVCMGIDIITSVFWNKKQQECLNQIINFDISAKYENKMKNGFVNFSWIALIGIFVLILNISGLACTLKERPILAATSFFVFGFSISLGVFKFLAVAMLIFIRLQSFNDKLATDLCQIIKLEEYHRNIFLETSWQHHEYLISAAKKLNALYSVQLLIWFSTLSLTSTLQIYGVASENDYNIYDAIRKLLIGLLFIILLIAIATICHVTANEANMMGKILSSPQYFKRCSPNEKLNIYLIGQHFQINSFHFSALGFFNINLPVLLTVGSAMTTYLVILMSPNER